MNNTVRELALAREAAAGDLETAIAALGVALRNYQRLTSELSERVQEDVSRRPEVLVYYHLNAAGLTPYLERKLIPPNTPLASLRLLIQEQHQRLPLADRAERGA